jgi:hypothetical protein
MDTPLGSEAVMLAMSSITDLHGHASTGLAAAGSDGASAARSSERTAGALAIVSIKDERLRRRRPQSGEP